ncbi:hypothetical protein GCM10007870_22940 [Gluconobacter kondonii]|uniref:Uncharacterized protein n=1 Tax=Gluconobacter kondonii TaxID=941463 RepID=A0ABQ5WTI7_9PROT|nr:hypothetical protein GCM10007870_22940 [Gluconobacter kondonii]
MAILRWRLYEQQESSTRLPHKTDVAKMNPFIPPPFTFSNPASPSEGATDKGDISWTCYAGPLPS